MPRTTLRPTPPAPPHPNPPVSTAATSSTLFATTFIQAGGTINGTFQNQGTFIYHSGQFNARLLNQGTLNLGPFFTATGGVENDAAITLSSNQTLNTSSGGLDNFGTFTLAGGTLAGPGLSLNDFGGTMLANGIINSPLTNNGLFTVTGTLHANAATGIVNNATFQGNGALIGPFNNNFGGTVLVSPGNQLAFTNNWTNNGLISLTGPTAILAGATITNSTTIQGAGAVNAPIFNTGTIRAQGGELDINSTLTNGSTAQLQSAANSTLFLTRGLSTNAGLIALQGGTLDNNNLLMTTTGSIEGSGTFRSGGLTITSTGFLVLADNDSAVYGPVTANPGANFKLISNTSTFFGPVTNTSTFFGPVTNNGTIKVTSATARFLGNGPSLTVGGSYISDPSDNYLTGLNITPSGLVSGGPGDRFFLTPGAAFTNAGTFTNGGLLDTSENITNSGNFTQTGPQNWSSTATFTNTAGLATFASNAKLADLTITAGTVDLTTAKFVIQPLANKSATLAALETNIANHSLISSTAPKNLGLALFDNAITHFSTFAGFTVDQNSLLLSPELLGDANIDGKVDLSDLSTILNHFGQLTPNWTDGNFDHAPSIDLTDLSDVLNNFGQSIANPTTSGLQMTNDQLPTTPTPEPPTLLALIPAVWSSAFRRRRGA